MSLQTRPFRLLAATQNIAVTATSQTVTFNNPLGTYSVRFCNVGTQVVFVLPFEGTAVAATVTNAIPIQAGVTEVFTMAPGTTGYTVIAAATGSTLYTTIGEGM